MKGLILAGGTGSRLWPATKGVTKQLLPLFDKPMIYFPLVTLMHAGCQEIAIITLPRERSLFNRILGDGSHIGLAITYLDQPEPKGLADAYLVAEAFLNNEPSCLVLGDNLFYGLEFEELLRDSGSFSGAEIFGQKVSNPKDYGVVEVAAETGKVLGIEEKPKLPKSDIAVTGIYFCDGSAAERAKQLQPSPRGELEITDLLNTYLRDSHLKLNLLPEGTIWMDTGTFDSLMDAAQFVKVVQTRLGRLVGSPEEVAWQLGYITDNQLEKLAHQFQNSAYGQRLINLLEVRA